MQTNKESSSDDQESGAVSDSGYATPGVEEQSHEATMQWLLELNRDEPEERVFIVAGAGAADFSLSAQEAAVAARPMIRGRADADDLSSYVGEEIVLGEEGSSASGGNGDLDAFSDAEVEALMAVEFSRGFEEMEEGLLDVEEGSDILGLEEEDDIGEQYLVVKRVKRQAGSDAAPAEPLGGQVQGGPAELAPTVAAADEPIEFTLTASAVEIPLAVATAVPEGNSGFIAGEAFAESVAGETGEGLELDETSVLNSGLEPLEFTRDEPIELELTETQEDEAYEPAVPVAADELDEDLGLELTADGFEAAAADLAPEQPLQSTEAETELPLAADDSPTDSADFDGLDLAALAAEMEATAEASAIGEPDLPAGLFELPEPVASVGRFEDFLGASEAGQHAPEIEEIDFSTVDSPVSAADPGDYHEDFRELVEEPSLHSVVMPRVAGLMTELETALSARLVAMGRPADSVLAEVSIAGTPGEMAAARSEGYATVAEVCSVMPEALLDLDAQQVEAIYLRLSDQQSGGLCNRIFHEDLPTEGAQDEVEMAESLHGLTDALVTDGGQAAEAARPVPGGLRLVESRVFEEDLLDNDSLLEGAFADASGEPEWELGSEEIDAIFDGLGNPDPFAPVFEELPGIGAGDAFSIDEIEPAVAENREPASAEDWSWCIPADISFSCSSPSGGEIFTEFLDAFIEEGSTELEKLENAISAWESDPANAEHQREVGRVLHTVKGIAKGVGLHFYGTLIHNFETLLEELPGPEEGASAEYFRIVGAWLDAAIRGIDFVQEQRRDVEHELPGAPPGSHTGDSAPELESANAASDPEVSAEPMDRFPAEPAFVLPTPSAEEARRREEDKRLADEGARALAAQQSVRITSEKLDLLLNLTNQAQQLGVRTTQSASRTKRSTAELQARLTSVRAHIADIASGAMFNVSSSGSQSAENLDALEMDRYSEIQEAANILREGVEDLADLIELVSKHNSQSEALLKQQATVISSIGSSIRAARVVPVSRLTPGLRRLVRTVSADLGKEVAFRVLNEVGTLDRDDYARCQTILEHMVRNALDHGLEDAATRQAAGKTSVGQITLDLRKSGGDSIIVISDDGRGMDPARIRETARRKGVEGDLDALSDEEALNLIFHKGFSTASEVSQISGRGVGMDIVASELQKMGGEIRISSEVGKGTSFHLKVPTNVAVNGALLVKAGESYFAIPLGGLIAVDEVPVDAFFDAVEQGVSLRLSAMECEPAYLGTLCKCGNLPERAAWRGTIPVLIAGGEERRMAIAVDDVEEALELVIRTLGAQFAAVPGVAGAATTADGEAVVALDLNVLVGSVAEGQGTVIAIDQPREEKLLALVVDDSRTQRMVATSQLETVGLETATAENGAVAIDWLNTTERLPDIVLMDVEMPVKDGIQALREIRKSPRFSDLPVIMITSRTGIKHRTLAEEAGCNGYMGKPFNFRMLIGQINDLTGHRLELEQQE
ncbi:hybrid sensor histidine kinase/response regulator [Haliea sp. E17]|uniref:hybrid sensor histidine kinase/response regulator n=1 Tax=Haliea sp. E17 TaxID=3401576 RepID=UPI003AAABA44